MESNIIDELWDRLMLLDNTWQIMYCWYDKTILANAYGQQVHADTLRAALEGAVAIAQPHEVSKWKR